MALMDHKNSEVLLSICIPTFNRPELLIKSIDSIVNQDIFQNTNAVEIVISDNFSSEKNSDIVTNYIKRYGSKIIYSKTDINILDKNFQRALSYGNGSYLKLSNDTLIYDPCFLEYMVNLITNNLEKKPILFFGNNLLKKKQDEFGFGLDFFVNQVSFYSTWIASFGIWKSDFDKIVDFNRSSKLQLIQTDILFELIQKNKLVFVSNTHLFNVQKVGIKGGFDVVTVFLDNYSHLLIEQVKQKNLSYKIYNREVKNVVRKFIIKCMILSYYKLGFNYHYNKGFTRLVHFFKKQPFFIVVIFVKFGFYFFKYTVKKLITKFQKNKL
jgi:glycosyltransferase involved in cell wall biosynthesis